MEPKVLIICPCRAILWSIRCIHREIVCDSEEGSKKSLLEKKNGRKKERKERKKNSRENLTVEDLNRLEEVRRSLNITSKPKGILKSSYNQSRKSQPELDDPEILLKNTRQNEYVNVFNTSRTSVPKTSLSSSTVTTCKSPVFSTSSSNNEEDRDFPFDMVPATTKVRAYEDHLSPVTPEKITPALIGMCNGEGLGNPKVQGTGGFYVSDSASLSLPKIIREEIKVRIVDAKEYNLNSDNFDVEGPEFFDGDRVVSVNGESVVKNSTKVLELINHESRHPEHSLKFEVKSREELSEIIKYLGHPDSVSDLIPRTSSIRFKLKKKSQYFLFSNVIPIIEEVKV
ncbi:unnamed protein product [Lepeophtheirus salmonis]|uniref:(salmon louse) hypothetical protein n=1 Tax=Lepeophtheirus salmonis TaxID=72036 RepID=A0A7R8CLI3_LEPSM|nr:unnamed protein product [Lepeophtheirus salmonis]CAF2852958.1 unnamed protein product [Lepeophtheirus salmonis]